MLATGALIASLLVVGASPANADTDTADHATNLSACVGSALDDHMFTDVADEHAFGDAINCVAYYGITNGTGDGSTYSPNAEVTRAQMAVFIARAAGAAGVDLGDAMDAGFTDIGDTWQEAQDAINQLGGKGVIPKGGEFRPDDAITRGEMATFLVGLLVKAAPNVNKDSTGAIKLGTGGTAGDADDYFADARGSVPRANDAEISAIYELGVTKGASAAAVQDDTKAPLDYNYDPSGTVNRGQMAAFITRALAHTSVRPAGVTAQYDAGDVIVSVRDDKFQPRPNTVVDLFKTDTGGADLAFRANGACGEVAMMDNMADSVTNGYTCEIDGNDPLTGGDGDTSGIELTGGVATGGTTVWAWTGANGDTVDSDTELYRLDIAEAEDASKANRVRVSTDFGGTKAHMGSSVLYTVQLEDADGAVSYGEDGKKPAQYVVSLTTRQYVGPGGAAAGDANDDMFRDGAVSVTPIPLTTDSDGKASFSISAPPDLDPSMKGDKWQVTATIVANPSNMNTPSAIHIGDSTDPVDTSATGGVALVRTLVFSTERSVQAEADITVSVEPVSGYVAAAARGATSRVKVTVTDQYGDPITGVKVQLVTDRVDSNNVAIPIAGGNALAVGRDGSYTFGYEREGADGDTEGLTATMTGYDHDGDGCSTANIADTNHRCSDLDGTGPGTATGTAPLTRPGTGTVQWAAAPSGTTLTTDASSDYFIREFDTEMNTIFVATGAGDTVDADSALVLGYDSNDRFNDDNGASSYAAFEKALAKGKELTWALSSTGGSRAVNVFTVLPAP